MSEIPTLVQRTARIAIAAMMLLMLGAPGQASDPVWKDPSLSPDLRAQAAVRAMTLDEKIAVVHDHVGTPYKGRPAPPGALDSAGTWPGVPRLGIPALQESDGSLGVANPDHKPELTDVTALPSGLAIAATFDPSLARQGGAMIGGEARAHGFGILLAGGANLIRDPRDGRSFEFLGEDPLLTGRMAGSMIAGIQSVSVISTLKHFALNDQETARLIASADITEAAARASDLLAFELAMEIGHPGAIMTSYNRVNGAYTSENAGLLKILKEDWHFGGFVMSDWGGTHSTVQAALAGLDQESGQDFDTAPYFAAPLKSGVVGGIVPTARLDDMVARVLRSDFGVGTADHPPQPGAAIDLDRDGEVARKIAREGIVLLKNAGSVLPLHADVRKIVIVGAHANLGVLSGGGSSQVVPRGAQPFSQEQPKHEIMGIKYYHPSAPTVAIQQRAPHAQVVFVSGQDHAAAAAEARNADIAIVFAEQWLAEAHDAPSLSLPSEQDQLIAAVAAANPRTVVVLETGSAVKMPWLANVPAVIEAWYAGSRGAEALTDVLFGDVDPSGRLPITFPQDEAQLPRPLMSGAGIEASNPGDSEPGKIDIDYMIEGADVGYKWFQRQRLTPLFPFGYGLSYTHFAYAGFELRAANGLVTASFNVRNEGAREGTDTPQVYAEPADHAFVRRLVGWQRVTLASGETRRVSVTVDPRLLATFDTAQHAWSVAAGRYRLSVRSDAAAPGPETGIALSAAHYDP